MPREHRYRPVVVLGALLVFGLALTALMNALAGAALAWPEGPIGQALIEGPDSPLWPGAYRLFRAGAVTTRVWLLLATMVLWLVWNFRVAANLALLQSRRPRYSASRAVWSWFVPVLNLLWPFQILQQVWQHSAAAARTSADEPPAAGQQLLKAWWLVWIALPLFNLAMPFILGERGSDGRRILSVWGVVALNGSWLIAAVLAALVVLRVSRWQTSARRASAPGRS